MEKELIINRLSNGFAKVGFTLKKYSPEILIVSGIAGVVTSAVMACKATTKISTILDKANDDLDTIKEYSAEETDVEKYSEEDKKKDIVIVYFHTGVDLLKLYGPSLILGALSITGILASNSMLRKRNVALAAAYATVTASFKEYRERVVEKYGDDAEKEIRYNIKAKKFEDVVLDDKGKEKKTKVTVNVADGNLCSDYALYFDNRFPSWERNIETNIFFLKSQQFYANKLLISRGHIFLNEVYDSLGIPRTPAGSQVGWVYKEDNERGDNQVDFGITQVKRELTLENGVSGYEDVVVLDFNVDGDIHNLI